MRLRIELVEIEYEVAQCLIDHVSQTRGDSSKLTGLKGDKGWCGERYHGTN